MSFAAQGRYAPVAALPASLARPVKMRSFPRVRGGWPGNRCKACASDSWQAPKSAEGAPGSGVRNLGLGVAFSLRCHLLGFSFRSKIHVQQRLLLPKIKRPTAPRPIPRMLHQSALHRIRMHVVQLFFFLSLAVYIEVMEPRLPQAPRRLQAPRKGKFSLSAACSFSSAAWQHAASIAAAPWTVFRGMARSSRAAHAPASPRSRAAGRIASPSSRAPNETTAACPISD